MESRLNTTIGLMDENLELELKHNQLSKTRKTKLDDTEKNGVRKLKYRLRYNTIVRRTCTKALAEEQQVFCYIHCAPAGELGAGSVFVIDFVCLIAFFITSAWSQCWTS